MLIVKESTLILVLLLLLKGQCSKTKDFEYPIMKKKKFDLQKRFIDYAVRIMNLSEKLPNTKIGNHIRTQLLRSGTSPAPNYGEAQSTESKSDFIHKLKITLKELRETDFWLKIIVKAELYKATKNKRIFPSDYAVFKTLYLVIDYITKK